MRKIIIILTITFVILLAASCSAPTQSGDVHTLKAIQLYGKGDYLEAVAEFKKAIELGVNEYELKDVYTMLGNCYTDLDMYDKGIEMHEASIALDGEYAESWVNLGITYRQSGDFDKAEECYVKASQIEPEYAQLHSSLGSLYILKNEPKKAIESFNKALELDSSIAVAYGNGALAYAMDGRYEEADEMLEQAIVLGYKNADVIRERIDNLKSN